MLDPNKPRILVALGGRSREREISIASGRQVAETLDRAGYPTSLLDIGTGRLLQLPELETIEKDYRKLPEVMNLPLTDIKRHFSLVFIAMHGRFGEDGGLQSILEEISVKYTGSRPLASALAMDKKFTKKIIKAAGIPTAQFQIIKNSEPQTPNLKIPFPVILKPTDQGSSIGVAICENEADYRHEIKNILASHHEVLVEPYLGQKELTVAILENKEGQPEPLPPIEIVPQSKLFDYRAKYSGTTAEIIPARFPKETLQEAQKLALLTYQELGCRHFARVDMMIDKNNRIQVLELNTIPGLTKESLLPKACRAAGLSFTTLVERLIRLSLNR